ncbi:MAG: hypothetical protein IPM91_19400 [Bacteroidetes bacterium]|nr:hypothetical protein [Bacteroidota bacterium]
MVYNGYESSIFNTLGKRNSDQFIFSVVGSIYPEQDISIMLNGLKNFLLDKSPDKVAVRFIGAAAIHSVAEKIQEAIPSDFLHISGRVPKQDALQETIDAHVLSYSGWAGVRGIISTKAFDYIASGNYVLIAPGDNDALDKLIQECKCGSSVNSAVEFENVLEKLYQSWLKEGKLPYLGDRDKIEFYSREHQAKRSAEMIVELIDNKSNSK